MATKTVLDMGGGNQFECIFVSDSRPTWYRYILLYNRRRNVVRMLLVHT